jgi:hypothetical protein
VRIAASPFIFFGGRNLVIKSTSRLLPRKKNMTAPKPTAPLMLYQSAQVALLKKIYKLVGKVCGSANVTYEPDHYSVQALSQHVLFTYYDRPLEEVERYEVKEPITCGLNFEKLSGWLKDGQKGDIVRFSIDGAKWNSAKRTMDYSHWNATHSVQIGLAALDIEKLDATSMDKNVDAVVSVDAAEFQRYVGLHFANAKELAIDVNIDRPEKCSLRMVSEDDVPVSTQMGCRKMDSLLNLQVAGVSTNKSSRFRLESLKACTEAASVSSDGRLYLGIKAGEFAVLHYHVRRDGWMRFRLPVVPRAVVPSQAELDAKNPKATKSEEVKLVATKKRRATGVAKDTGRKQRSVVPVGSTKLPGVVELQREPVGEAANPEPSKKRKTMVVPRVPPREITPPAEADEILAITQEAKQLQPTGLARPDREQMDEASGAQVCSVCEDRIYGFQKSMPSETNKFMDDHCGCRLMPGGTSSWERREGGGTQEEAEIQAWRDQGRLKSRLGEI